MFLILLISELLQHCVLQIRKVLYDHVFNICSTYHIPYTKNKEDRSIKIGTGTCYGFSGESPDECLGMTNAHGFIMDEAARCPEVLYKNLSERCRGDGVDVPHHRLISSPLAGEPTAEWFVNLKKENPDCVIHGSLYEALAAKFVSERFVRSMEKIYPIGSELYKQQILGEDIESDFLNAIVKDSDFSDEKFLIILLISKRNWSTRPISIKYFLHSTCHKLNIDIFTLNFSHCR